MDYVSNTNKHACILFNRFGSVFSVSIVLVIDVHIRTEIASSFNLLLMNCRDLSSNSITRIDIYAFSGMTSLVYL